MKGEKEKDSILHTQYFRDQCYMCMQQGDYSLKPVLEKHHVFMGPLRKISEKEGLYVYLCPECHRYGKHAVHRDYAVCRMIQQEAQKKYEETHSRAEFMRIMGRSYIQEGAG